MDNIILNAEMPEGLQTEFKQFNATPDGIEMEMWSGYDLTRLTVSEVKNLYEYLGEQLKSIGEL